MGLEVGMRDLGEEKSEYDNVLLTKGYDKISYYVVTLDHAIPIMCTVGFTPEIDFEGNRLQTLDEPMRRADNMTISILKTTSGTAVILAWLTERLGACSGLVNSLDRLKPHRLPTALVTLVFEHGENVFFTPSWWDRLAEPAKVTIEKHANSFTEKPASSLELDGSLHVLWSIRRAEKVIRTQTN